MLKKIILLSTLFCLPFTMSAQTALEKCYAREKELKEQIATAEGETDSLLKVTVRLREILKEKRSVVSRLEQVFDSLSATNPKEELNALIQELEALRTDSASVCHANDSIRNEQKAVSERVERRKQEISDKGAITDLMNAQTKQKREEDLQAEYLANLTYFAMAYHDMDAAKLRRMADEAELHQKQTEYENYKLRLENAIAVKKLYDDATALLCIPYHRERVLPTLDSLNFLLQIKADNTAKKQFRLTETQRQDVDALTIKVARYRKGTSELQNMMKKVCDAVAQESGKPEDARKSEQGLAEQLNKNFISPVTPAAKSTIENYILMSPYLKLRYEQFRESRSKAPYSPTVVEGKDIEEEVLSIDTVKR